MSILFFKKPVFLFRVVIALVLYLGGVTLEINLGQRIKAARKKSCITQKELAKSLGKSERMIQKYESNEVHPSLDVISAISEALGVKFDDIFGIAERIKLTEFVKEGRKRNNLQPIYEELSKEELEYNMKNSIAEYLNSYNINAKTINKTVDIILKQIELVIELNIDNE